MKRFQFKYEEVSWEDLEDVKPMTSELSVHLDDWAKWTEALGFFACFLEGIGYVGVREKLANILDDDMELNDETPSNS